MHVEGKNIPGRGSSLNCWSRESEGGQRAVEVGRPCASPEGPQALLQRLRESLTGDWCGLKKFFLFFFLAVPRGMRNFPAQRLNPCPL